MSCTLSLGVSIISSFIHCTVGNGYALGGRQPKTTVSPVTATESAGSSRKSSRRTVGTRRRKNAKRRKGIVNYCRFKPKKIKPHLMWFDLEDTVKVVISVRVHFRGLIGVT